MAINFHKKWNICLMFFKLRNQDKLKRGKKVVKQKGVDFKKKRCFIHW